MGVTMFFYLFGFEQQLQTDSNADSYHCLLWPLTCKTGGDGGLYIVVIVQIWNGQSNEDIINNALNWSSLLASLPAED